MKSLLALLGCLALLSGSVGEAQAAPKEIRNMAVPFGLNCHNMECIRTHSLALSWRLVVTYGREVHNEAPQTLKVLNANVSDRIKDFARVRANPTNAEVDKLMKAPIFKGGNKAHLKHLPGTNNPAKTRRLRAYAVARMRAFIHAGRKAGKGEQVLAWLDHLTTGGKDPGYDMKVPKVQSGNNTKEIHVQGGGPAGLAAVARALHRGLAVSMTNDRCSYTRSHIVDLRSDAGTGGAQIVGKHGASSNASGMSTFAEQMGLNLAKAAGLVIYENQSITISDLEYFMAVTVWLVHQDPIDKLTWKGCSDPTKNKSYKQLRAATADELIPPQDVEVPAAIPGLTPDRRVPGNLNWPAGATPSRPVIFADGANSKMAQELRASGKRLRAVSHTRPAPPLAVSKEADNVHRLRNQDNTVVFAMWIFEVEDSSKCPKAQDMSQSVVGQPELFPGFLPEWAFGKAFSGKKQCLIELGFRRDVGEHFLAAFGNGFAWPRGTVSPDSQKRATILFHMLRILLPLTQNGLSGPAFDQVVEMKVFRSLWGMPTSKLTSRGEKRVPVTAFKSITSGGVPADKSPCGILLGDAQRPALTAFAMGVNAAAVEAHEIIETLAKHTPSDGCSSIGGTGDGTVAMREMSRVKAIGTEIRKRNAKMKEGIGDKNNWSRAFEKSTKDIAVLRAKKDKPKGSVVLRDTASPAIVQK